MRVSEVIESEYTKLKVALNQRFDNKFNNLFPSLSDMNISDLVYFICVSFPSTGNFAEVIKTMAFYYRIPLEEQEITEIVEIIKPTILFIRNLK